MSTKQLEKILADVNRGIEKFVRETMSSVLENDAYAHNVGQFRALKRVRDLLIEALKKPEDDASDTLEELNDE